MRNDLATLIESRLSLFFCANYYLESSFAKFLGYLIPPCNTLLESLVLNIKTDPMNFMSSANINTGKYFLRFHRFFLWIRISSVISIHAEKSKLLCSTYSVYLTISYLRDPPGYRIPSQRQPRKNHFKQVLFTFPLFAAISSTTCGCL